MHLASMLDMKINTVQNQILHMYAKKNSCGPFLLIWFNFNPSMDK